MERCSKLCMFFMDMILLTVIVSITSIGIPVNSENILLTTTNPMLMPSHYMTLSAITGGLVANGHNVTLITNNIKGTNGFAKETFTKVLFFNASYSVDEVNRMNDNTDKGFQTTNIGFWKRIAKVYQMRFLMYESCTDLWNDHELLRRLKATNFDLVLVFPFSSCDVLMANYLETQFAVITSSLRLPMFHEGFIGMPYPSSYVPFNLFDILTDTMTFFERMKNLAMPFLLKGTDIHFDSYYHSIQLQFNIHPDKTVTELYAKTSLWLSHTSLACDFSRPYTPNFVPIGGLISHPPHPLPKELENFVNGSGEHGVIVFTLGSGVKGIFNEEVAEIFARVFSNLPQRVIWRHDAKTPSGLGENTKLVKWLPQNDLLGHPKTRLLIYHGGSNGVYEAIYHAVPMLIIPLFGDQYTHGARIQKKGIGLVLKKTDVTEYSLTEVIQELLNNPTYKETMKHVSNIHHDEHMTPLKRAVYWIEHVMKFGADHLRPRSADMNFIELYMIDVTVFLLTLLAIGLYIDYWILKKIISCCCGGRSSKSKTD